MQYAQFLYIFQKLAYRKIACVAAMVVSSQFKTTKPYLWHILLSTYALR